MKPLKQIIPLLLVTLLAQGSWAQEDYKRLAIELDGGATYPNMDINGQFGPFGQFGIRYNISEYFGLRGDFGMGQINGGEDEWDRVFTNQYMRYSLNGVFNLGRMANLHKTSSGINLLFNIGFGGHNTEITEGEYLTYDGFVKPRDELEQNESRDYTEPYENLTNQGFVTSFGGKVSFKLSNSIALNLGATYHMGTNDLMDGFNASTIANNYDDRYTTTHLGLSIYLGSGKNHADWKAPGKNKELKENTKSNQKAIKNMDDKINDTDGDGVIDAIDQDNATKDEIRVNAKGLPMDTDYDGIPDHLDDCPTVEGVKDNNGCPPDTVATKKDKEKARKGGGDQEMADQRGGTGDRRGGGGTGGTDSREGTDKREGGERKGDTKEKSLTKDADYPKREYSKEEVENYPVVTVKSTTDAKEQNQYFVIGGSFNVKSNAIDFKKYLGSEGFNSKILFVKEKNLFRVAFAKFSDEDQARSKLDEIRSKFNPNAWLLMQ